MHTSTSSQSDAVSEDLTQRYRLFKRPGVDELTHELTHKRSILKIKELVLDYH